MEMEPIAIENLRPIKRPLSAYMIFSAHERQRMKVDDTPKLSFTESTKYISKRWSEIDEIEKQKYVELAEEDKQRYKRETAEAGATGRMISQGRVAKKRKMKRKPKVVGGPKRPMSSFFLFCQDKRPEVRAELGDASQNIAIVGKRLGQLWQEETVEVKQRYKERADLDKMRYDREMAEFQEQQQQQQQQQLELDPSIEMDSD